MREQIQLLAKTLVDNGLEYAFGVTGSGLSLLLITELEGLGVRYYPASHEASAALMAGAVSRITDRVSVSISIKGPGLANMLPGIVFNYFEGHPCLSISEAFGAEVSSFRMHKRLDHVALLSAVVKGVISLSDLDQLSVLLRAARSEVPGPVHLDLCARDTATLLDEPSDLKNEPETGSDLVSESVRRIRNSQRPVLIVGSLAARRPWRAKLASLGVPVFTTAATKGVLDENLAHNAGVFTGEGKELAPETHVLAEADLIIGIGLRNTEVLSPKPFGRYTIMLDEVDGKPTEGFRPDLLLTAASQDFVSIVVDELRGRSWGLERLALLKHRLRAALLDGNWLPGACFEVLNGLDYPYALLLDTGSFCTVGEHLWEATSRRLFLGGSNSRYMGTAIPSSLGVAVCKPDLPLFCVVGDGGMGMYPSEIKLAVEERLPVCFLFITDGRYGSVACVPQPKPLSLRAVSIPRPSWWRAIEGMGCEAHLVKSQEAFEKVVLSWRIREPLFIEAVFDPVRYARMTERLR